MTDCAYEIVFKIEHALSLKINDVCVCVCAIVILQISALFHFCWIWIECNKATAHTHARTHIFYTSWRIIFFSFQRKMNKLRFSTPKIDWYFRTKNKSKTFLCVHMCVFIRLCDDAVIVFWFEQLLLLLFLFLLPLVVCGRAIILYE